MKKITALILVIVFLLSLCGCSITDPFITADHTDKGYWGRVIKLKDNSKETLNEKITSITVNETELDTEIYDENLISVTATKLSYDEAYGPAITFEVCNLSEHNITVDSTLVIINGWVYPASFSIEVPSIEITEYTLYLSESELINLNISEICKIEVKLKVTDTDTAEFSGVSQTTMIYYNEETNYKNISYCEEILSHDDITIRIEETKEKDNENRDYIGRIFILNENNKDISLKFNDISLNGIDTAITTVINAPANNSVYHELYFDKSILKENNIENLETILMRFDVYYTDTNEIIFDSGETLYEIVS